MEHSKVDTTIVTATEKAEESGSWQDHPSTDAAVEAVPTKYRGTAADQRDMHILGKKQVLRRNFEMIAMLGFASTVIVSWEVLLPLFYFTIIDGGPALLFWGFIAITSGMIFVYASLAEMASMCPTAGGQYHFVSEFAPSRYQKFLSYITGWLCAIGWQVFLAGVCFMVGGIIQGLIALNVEDYVWHNYHGTLLTIAVIVFSIAFNTVFANHLPMVERFLLVLHLAGFLGIVIPLWIKGPGDSANVLLRFENNGNWPTTGIAAMIGLQAIMSTAIGYDCSVHMSEETRDASLTMPKAIMWSMVPNALLAFILAITLIFNMGDGLALLDTPTYQPFIQLFYNVTGSYVGTNVMVAVVIVLLTSCCISELATSSRQIWSFARDQGLPFSSWLAKVSPGRNIPLRAVWVSLVISSLLSCINLGSTTALNAINSLGGVSILTSYFITIGCLVWRRLYGAPLPPRRWSLGKWGLPINIVALMFLTPVWFFEFWPLARPITPENMSWSSAMFGGLMIVAIIYYHLHAKYVYRGPVTDVKREV